MAAVIRWHTPETTDPRIAGEPMLSRRNFLLCACVAAGAIGCSEGFAQDSKHQHTLSHFDSVEAERHTIFMALATALVGLNWRIDKGNRDVRLAYRSLYPSREFREYSGHNIGALVVDNRNTIVCFRMNENVYFNSSLEHAELRAITHSITRANASRFRSGRSSSGYSAMLQGHKVYTTLESCSQCSGAMDLANIPYVFFLQPDPGQKLIGQHLYNLHAGTEPYGAPMPVHTNELEAQIGLTDAYAAYLKESNDNGGPIGMTSFLQTIEAYKCFAQATTYLASYKVDNFQNAWILKAAIDFLGSSRNGAI